MNLLERIFQIESRQININNNLRALLGFIFGLIIMIAAVNVFVVNSYDYENIQQGTRVILSGVNPWASDTRVYNYYNPPFSIIFLWPLLFTTPEVILSIGGAFLFAVVFYQKTWVALAWFLTNSALWVIAAGGVDMFVMGAGLLLLFIGDSISDKQKGIFFRVLAYGFLMVKPQGGIFIVFIYIVSKQDWKAFLISIIVYVLLFSPFYPDWVRVVLTNPPQAQNVATHSLWGKFGAYISIPIAVWVSLTRRWNYWQLGGVLAGILAPYGMPGIPIFITLSAVNHLIAIPIVFIYSGLLAAITWITPPSGVDFYAFSGPLMAIYHLSLFGLAIILACYSFKETNEYSGDMAKRESLLKRIHNFFGYK
jgi:hypothetical protein